MLVVGLIGVSAVNLVGLELRQGFVQIQHQCMEELNVKEKQLGIVTCKDVLVKTLLIRFFSIF